ncbi:MAG: hypothetical protein IKU49_05405, partial [Prevotella sp.]|nr:hypothetical protein [Prevotella sp.]
MSSRKMLSSRTTNSVTASASSQDNTLSTITKGGRWGMRQDQQNRNDPPDWARADTAAQLQDGRGDYAQHEHGGGRGIG